jgi:hypothetical protein
MITPLAAVITSSLQMCLPSAPAALLVHLAEPVLLGSQSPATGGAPVVLREQLVLPQDFGRLGRFRLVVDLAH